MTLLLLNPNTDPDTTAEMVAIARRTGTETALSVEGRTAAFGVRMIVEPAALAEAARAVAVPAEVIAREPNVEGVIIAAFGDPGLEAARKTLAVPVCSIGEASFRQAGAGGRRFAVATTTPGLVDAIAGRVSNASLQDCFAGTFLTTGDPFALVADPACLVSALAEACERARSEAGAEAVIIGGGPLARAATEIAARVEMTVVEPIPAAVRLIREMITGRENRPLR